MECGYDEGYAKVTLSNRPDLCEYQCNGAMAAAKAYKKKPIEIAQAVVEKVQNDPVFEHADAVMPGFINLKIGAGFLAGYLEKEDYGHALKLGTAAGGATAFSDGLGSGEMIRELYETL